MGLFIVDSNGLARLGYCVEQRLGLFFSWGFEWFACYRKQSALGIAYGVLWWFKHVFGFCFGLFTHVGQSSMGTLAVFVGAGFFGFGIGLVGVEPGRKPKSRCLRRIS